MTTRTWGTIAVAMILAISAYYGASRGAKASGAPSSSSAPAAPRPRMCNPATQQGCGSGERCSVICEGNVAVYGCEPNPGGAEIGESCGSSTKCRRGMCLEYPGSHPACAPYCESDADCGSGLRCDDAKIKFRCSMDPSGISRIPARVCRPQSLSIPTETNK